MVNRNQNVEDSRYRLLVDSITDYAIYMLDPTGKVSSWNPGAERFKGYLPHEIIGEHFSRFYTDEDRATGLPSRALHVAQSEGRFEQEGWRVRKDGTRFWAHVVIDPIRSPAGGILGFAKITRDLTERRLATEALRRSQEQFQILVNGVTDYAIYMLDPQGRVTNWNSGAERIKGYTSAEILGRHFSQFYTPEDREAGRPADALETAAREGRFEREGCRLRKDGTRFWAHVVIDAVRGDDGEIVGFAKVTRDITERVKAQQELEVAREALFQSQKLEAIGQLTGGIAHDFNNLLSAILGSLDLARKRMAFDPRVSPLLENAILAARRGATLTQRMLAFARKQDLKIEAVALPTLVTGMQDFIQRTLGPTVEIEVDLPRDLPPVLTDPFQFENALLNLAVNARDAMPSGGTIRITGTAEAVSRHTALTPGAYVKLTVRDTGEGMDAETLQRASDPFFTTKGVGKGTGLGLSMVQGLMLQTGGRLDIDSRPGQGTSVNLWIPVGSAAHERAPEQDRGSQHRSVGRLRILAVDDDPLVLTNTAALLEDLGHHVTTAASGKQALALLNADLPVDLVITDQVMPHMNGSALIARVKERLPDLPTILATGFAEMDGEVDAASFRLPKPFTQIDVARAIEAVSGSSPPA